MSLKHKSIQELFTETANAIRAQTGSSKTIVADDFPEEILNIQSSSGPLVTEDIEIIATKGKFAKWITGEATSGAESSVNWATHSQFIPAIPEETLCITCKTATHCLGIYAFGFHGDRDDETWITEDSLMEIIDYINAKENCEITTYSAVFDAIGTTNFKKRITRLEKLVTI